MGCTNAGEHFPPSRTVREYTEQHYFPAAANYLERAADKGAAGARVVKWQQALDEKWAALRFGEVNVETTGKQHIFDVQIYLDDLDPESVRVELYAVGANGGGPVRQEMTRVRPLMGAAHGYLYSAEVPALRPAADYTPRVIPHCPGVAVPLEAAHILWRGRSR